MRRIIRRIKHAAISAWTKTRNHRRFRGEFLRFRAMGADDGRFQIRWQDRHPIMHERTETTPIDSHYVYHTAWASRILARTRPQRHVDISSYVYFSVIASAFVPIDFYDYRPVALHLSGLSTGAQDLTALTFADNSIPSLSCMHVIEHIGLGRYGDPLDPRGDLRAARELRRVLAPGGLLLLAVPIGWPCLCFNAHRIYGYEQVLSMFDGLVVEEFALLPDDASGGLILNAPKDLADRQKIACGCFALRKPL